MARCELGQRLDNADGLLIKILIHRADNFHFSYATVFVHNKMHNDFTLNIALGGFGWIIDMSLDVLHQRNHPSRELGLLLISNSDRCGTMRTPHTILCSSYTIAI